VTRDDLIRTANSYRWYHRIKIEEGIYTESAEDNYQPLWDFILNTMRDIDFKNKRVLDAGCRDGMKRKGKALGKYSASITTCHEVPSNS
jgi:hypothetical protein